MAATVADADICSFFHFKWGMRKNRMPLLYRRRCDVHKVVADEYRRERVVKAVDYPDRDSRPFRAAVTGAFEAQAVAA